jgi:hypothetical protein
MPSPVCRVLLSRTPSVRVVLTVHSRRLYIIWLSAYWLTRSYHQWLGVSFSPVWSFCSVVVCYLSRSFTTRIFLVPIVDSRFETRVHCLYGKLLMCYLIFFKHFWRLFCCVYGKLLMCHPLLLSPGCPLSRCSREVTEKLWCPVLPVLPLRLNELVTNCTYVVIQCVGVEVWCGVLPSFPINYLTHARFSFSCFSLICIQSDVQFGIDISRSQSDRLLRTAV